MTAAAERVVDKNDHRACVRVWLAERRDSFVVALCFCFVFVFGFCFLFDLMHSLTHATLRSFSLSFWL